MKINLDKKKTNNYKDFSIDHKSKRIKWVDVTKGYTIILMVAGHSALPPMIQWLIFSFHMPLFFILSGITTNWEKDSFILFSIRKLNSLGIPFISYSTICIIIIRSLNLVGPSWWHGWGDYALWFVPVLLIGILIAKAIMYCPRCLKLFLICLLLLCSTILNKYNIVLPWNMSVAPYATFFIVLGGIINKKILKNFENLDSWWIIPLFGITFLFSQLWHLDMARNQCIPIAPITISAITGTMFIALISIITDRYASRISTILQAIGKETFIILSFSQIIILSFNKFFDMNVVIKYILLILILFVAKIIKDLISLKYQSIKIDK